MERRKIIIYFSHTFQQMYFLLILAVKPQLDSEIRALYAKQTAMALYYRSMCFHSFFYKYPQIEFHNVQHKNCH